MGVKSLLRVIVLAWLFSNILASPSVERATSRQLLVGYWGQNAAGPQFGRWNYEKNLRHFCENFNYDIYVIGFVHRLFDPRHTDRLPGMNFAHHCSYAPDPKYPGIYECATIGGAIRDCQKRGKKVLISLGGDTCDGTLGSAANARFLANNIWNMFLGGQSMPNKRPFLHTVLDGVDLDIEIGSYQYYPDFVKELRRLMRTDSSKQYLLTAAPQCPYPDKWMGPVNTGTAFKEVGYEFDYLFIQFYNNYCYPGSPYFVSVMDTWLKWSNGITNGPLIMLGLPAGVGAAGKPEYYFPPDQLANAYKKIRDKPGVGGLMFWECSWDQNNIINNKHYSEYAFQLVSGGSITPPSTSPPPTQPPVTNPPPTQPPVTNPPLTQPPVTDRPQITTQAPPLATTSPPTGQVNCASSPDGYYPHSSDCSKFIICSSGVQYIKSCPAGLYYNKINKYCDWPQNVQC